jgi:hypothetical protein
MGREYLVITIFVGEPMVDIILAIVICVQMLVIIHLKLKSGHHDGKMVIEDGEEGKTIFSLNLDGDPMELINRPSVSFKVVSTKN